MRIIETCDTGKLEKMKKVILSLVVLVFGILAYKLVQHSIVDSKDKNIHKGSQKNENLQTFEPSDFSKKVLAIESKVTSGDLSGFKIKRTGWDLEIVGPNLVTHKYKGEIDSYGSKGFYFVVEKRENPLGLLLFIQFYEGWGFSFITADGQELPIEHFPFFSPSGDKVAVVHFADANEFSGWQILEKVDGKFVESGIMKDLKWKDHTYFTVQFQSWSEDENKVNIFASFPPDKRSEGDSFVCHKGQISKDEKGWTMNIDDSVEVDNCPESPPIENPELKELFEL